ncbi:hypothetical protein RPMA_18160 [Tardiphaga alba]|uniref:Uncharacterized protein n=1 Tax=Tardiphaga alba TaxID=340268 RepID=A0ABX8AA30_9BRAD|nr:hypothetical protein [Tardiphaga alba]QUS40542.1 hypothetical protein RPMA_18160 [Tardiphaga alba]
MLNTTVRTGAAAVSRTAQKNPLEILIQLVEGDPTADADRLFGKWQDIVRDDEDLLTPVLRHTFTNLLTCVDRDRRRASPRATTRAAPAAAQQEQQVERIKAQVVSVILMNLTLPSGKLLRDSKFKDCAKAGGWFAKIAKMGKPDQVVGRTVSEETLRAIPF